MRQIKVWDLPTRLFHWLLVAFVLFELIFAEEEGTLFVAHNYIGYGVLLLLVFRLVWGFSGGEHARFADFIKSPGATLSYGRTMLAGKPAHFAGHNPLGGWMVIAMLATLAVVVFSGLVVQGEEDIQGPLTAYFSEDTMETFEEIHEVSANLMIALIIAHVLGVIISSRLHGQNLVHAMVTGRKSAEKGSDARSAPALLFPILLAALAALGYWMVSVSDIPVDHEHEGHDEQGAMGSMSDNGMEGGEEEGDD